MSVKCIWERLIYASRLYLWIDQIVQRWKTALQKVLLRERHQIHSYLVHINIQITWVSHRACHIVNHICNYWIFFLKMIRFFFYISSFYYRWTFLYLILQTWFISSWESSFWKLDFLVLLINSRNDIKKCLIINR